MGERRFLRRLRPAALSRPRRPFAKTGGFPLDSLLAEFDDTEAAAALVFGDLGFLRADADPSVLESAARRFRVFAGYAGWGAGQLEAELALPSWFVETPELEDVFSDDPEHLWNAVLRRKGGQFALIATMPPDPSLN